MSLSGKLLRGLKWHNFRNIDGIYSKDITEDPHKMEELEFYLDFIKDKDAKAVYKILEKVMIYDLSNRPAEMEKEAKKLNDTKLTSKDVPDEQPKTEPKEKKDVGSNK